MTDRISKEKFIIITGIVGITAAFLTIVSDIILLGRPDSSYSFFRLGTESMAGLAPWRITVGTFLGVFSLPFQIAGIIPLYYGLKPAGNRAAAVVFFGSAYALIMGVAFHVSYSYMGSAWMAFYEPGSANTALSVMMTRFDFYWKIIIIAVFIVLLIVSLFLIFLIMSGKSIYPKWMAFFNPVCVFLMAFFLIVFIPAPVGGFISPTILNLCAMTIFILSFKAHY